MSEKHNFSVDQIIDWPKEPTFMSTAMKFSFRTFLNQELEGKNWKSYSELR